MLLRFRLPAKSENVFTAPGSTGTRQDGGLRGIAERVGSATGVESGRTFDQLEKMAADAAARSSHAG
jgi:hypothetical protein